MSSVNSPPTALKMRTDSMVSLDMESNNTNTKPIMTSTTTTTSNVSPLSEPEKQPLEPIGKDASTRMEPTTTIRDLYTVPNDPNTSRSNLIKAMQSDMRPNGLGFQFTEADVLDVDKNTPDDWVPRSKHMIRLTGKHPFNCEAEIGMLMDQGFFTPPALHYIRNHGYAMKDISWDTHTFTINGCVTNPLTISMDQLAAMPSVSLPVTLVCAGNRRKEQNMTKQTIGFSWGPCGVSTHMWTGVRLRDLLLQAGVDLSRAKYVSMVGAETLPKGPYGTSIPISLAMDEFAEVLVAYENNGMRLTPDHGFPVRVIIPGWIGGRMVKWLKEITVSETPSDNYYHFFDNRILPPQVDSERANAEGWWYKPEYMFNELNINSAMASPNHDERMDLSATPADGKYTMRGYAYSGGGRNVTRVEVSFDGGKTWDLCDVDRPEEKFSHTPKYDRYYCWVLWTYTVPAYKFMECAMGPGEVMCRAWDCSNNTQPAHLTWNLMGMGNNPYFRVRIHPEKNNNGGFSLRFEHPTVAGPTKGGWMNPLTPEELAAQSQGVGAPSSSTLATVAASQAPPSAPASSTSAAATTTKKDSSKTYFTWDAIKKHDNEQSAWIVVRGKVYDCTPFLKDHPGGGSSIVMNAGTDSTEEFDAIHSSKAQKMLDDYYIGELDDGTFISAEPDSDSDSTASTNGVQEAKVLIALNPKEKISCPLIEKESISYNVRRLRFALPSKEHVLGLPVGYHMLLSAKVNDKLVMRAYTPTSTNDNLGYFELVVKVYFKNEHPKFPEGGVFSQYLDSMNIGDSVFVKGPIGHFEYKRHGHLIVEGENKNVKHLGFICAGSGITPAYQVIKQILKDSSDTTQVRLVYANQKPSDILLRDELDAWSKAYPNFKVWYTVDSVPASEEALETDGKWKYSVGYISHEMLRDHLVEDIAQYQPEDILVGMCGPPPMIKFACIPNLEKIGLTKTQYVQF